MVTDNNLTCCVLAITSYDEDDRMAISPQKLKDFNEVDKSEDFFHSDKSEGESVSIGKRLDKIIESLRLDHLNKEEKDHVIKIITDYQHLFHLAGEPLPSTDALHHSIHTTDNIPVCIKQYRYPPEHRGEMQK